MSKKSFNEIEQVIKHAMEDHEPAFKETSWTKMEALLDSQEDRKRPFIFWLWILLPLLITTGGIGYHLYKKRITPESVSAQTTHTPNQITEKIITVSQLNEQVLAAPVPDATTTGAGQTKPGNSSANEIADLNDNSTGGDGAVSAPKRTVTAQNQELNNQPASKKTPHIKAVNAIEDIAKKNKITNQTNAKMKGSVTAAETGDDEGAQSSEVIPATPVTGPKPKKEEVVVVKIETDNKDEKKVEKIVDSVIESKVNDKKEKNRISRFYIVVAAGAEGSGTRLCSVDKITARTGLAIGYNINKNLSVQAGFFMSDKKYTADGSSYKTKPGTYWNIVDIKEIDANCKVYEIPVQLNYNFTPGKKWNVFGSVGLSSYIMKKEDYSFHYTRYGSYHKASANYSGNKSLFSVLRIGAGVEKKIGKRFSAFAAPGISIPLSGVGEGEVKLYSAEIMIGLKFTPLRKHK